MSPLEREVKELRELVQAMLHGENVAFVESMRRRILLEADVSDLPDIKLSDLTDVGSDTDSPSTGEVLKYDGTDWSPGTDNTA